MRLRRTTILALAALITIISLSPVALAEDVSTKFRWGQPTIGSEPVRYHVERRFRDDTENATWGVWGQMGSTEDLSIVLPLQVGMWHQIRVRAEDVVGVFGPYSKPSEPFLVPDEGEPEVETSNLGPLSIGGDKPKGPDPVPD